MDAQGKTALSYMADFGGAQKVSKLLEFSADPFVGDPTGSKILFCLLHHLETYNQDPTLLAIKSLLSAGCDPKARNEQGQTALHILAHKDEPNRFFTFFTGRFMNTLISFVDEAERSAYVNATDDEGKSALFYAARCHCHAAAKVCLLLDHYADPFLSDLTGSSILNAVLCHISYVRGDNDDDPVRAVTKLLELGCHPQVEDENGESALLIWIKQGYRKSFNTIIDLLLSFVDDDQKSTYVSLQDHEEGKSALFYAVEFYLPYKANRLLDLAPIMGLNLNLVDHGGRTVLHSAVVSKYSSAKLVLCLLDCGADANIQDEDGNSALHLLSKKPNLSPNKSTMVAHLLSHGSDPILADSEGNLPLYYLGERKTFDPTSAFLLMRCMLQAGYKGETV